MTTAYRIVIIVFIYSFLSLPEASAGLLSNSDLQAGKLAFKSIEQRRWQKARRLAGKVKEPVLEKLILWHLATKAGAGSSFEEIESFRRLNSGWPWQKTLKMQAEDNLPLDLPAHTVIGWMDDQGGPSSTIGRVRYAEALLFLGKTAEGTKMLRETWIDWNFTKEAEKAFYNNHKKRLSRQDHIDRMERLIWSGKYWPAKRMLPRVPDDYRKLGIARLYLMKMEGNVDKAIAAVPKHLHNHSGLVYERIRWRRRKGKDDDAIKLLEKYPGDGAHPEKWWFERASLARRALHKGHVSDAYRLVKGHKLVERGADLAEAEWMAGWIALRFLNDFDVALDHFVRMYQSVSYPVSLARGAYWAARAAEALKKPKITKMWLTTAAQYPTTYYGQLAHAKLYPGKALVLPKDPTVTPDYVKRFNNSELTKAVRILFEIGNKDKLTPFIMALKDIDNNPKWRLLTASLAHTNGRPDLSISVAKKSAQDGPMLIQAGYPTLSPPKVPGKQNKMDNGDRPVEIPLVLAMIRQESAFRTMAKSHANARGLMQLMPGTANLVAKQVRMRYSRKKLMTDPAYNLKLGQAYIADLLRQFDGSYVLALAAYNAGPARAKQWSRLNGEPGEAGVDVVDWVELVPFDETRNYIQRVMENLQVYRHRLSQTQVAVMLDEDLYR